MDVKKLTKDATDETIKEYVFGKLKLVDLARDWKSIPDKDRVGFYLELKMSPEKLLETFYLITRYDNPTNLSTKDRNLMINLYKDIFPSVKKNYDLMSALKKPEVLQGVPQVKPMLNSSYFALPPQIRPIKAGSILYNMKNNNQRLFVVDDNYNNFLVQKLDATETWEYDPSKVIKIKSYDPAYRKFGGVKKFKSPNGIFIEYNWKKWSPNRTGESFAGFDIFDKATKNISNTKITNPIEELELPDDPETKKFKIPKTQLEAELEEENPVKGLKIPVQLSEEQIREKKEKQLKAFEKERKRREEELKSEALKRARKMLKGTEVRKDEIKEAIRFKKESERIAKQIQEMKGQKRNLIGGSSKKPTEKEEREKEEKLKEKRKREAKAREESKKRMDEQLDPEFIKRQQELEKKKKEAKEKKKREAKAMFMKMRGKGKGKI